MTQTSAPIVVGDVQVAEVDYRALPEDDIAAYNAFRNVMLAEAHPEDPPEPLDVTRADVRTLPESTGVRTFHARAADGAIVAEGYGWWRRTETNKHMLWIGIDVVPEYRRRGIGKVLLGLLVGVARDDNRTMLMGNTGERVPAGEAFARRVGAEPGSAIHTNRLLLADVDRELVREWVEHGPQRAPGYSLVTNDGRYPDDLIEQVVSVYHVMNTAPRDDLDVEDEVHTVEMVRQWEASRDAQGTIRWSVFARHDASGELIGLSEIYWNPAEPETMYQGDTGVDPGHRGHALGKWMKAHMIERILAERPGIVDIRTGNADSNDAMLGINNALGFRPYIAQTNWQVPVERVEAYLSVGGRPPEAPPAGSST